jgi:hypothetical protein
MNPVYRFLSDHNVNGVMYEAGSVHEMPETFIPSGLCEPMNADAALIFWRAGPQPTPYIFNGLRVAPPKTYWKWEVIPGCNYRRWSLTGLGAEFGDDIVA